MLLQDKLQTLLNAIKNGIEGENFDSFIAFPNVYKPTKLSKSVIAVCQGEIEAKPLSLTGEGLIGNYTIDADVFSPWDKGSAELTRLAEKAVKATLFLNPVRVAVSPVRNDAALKCYSIKCSFTFNERIWE
ncbi:MAG: hypothetical protein IJT65_05075 [Eubacterium sp.]|nr:hypothetical protein [Eubacterium sp.]